MGAFSVTLSDALLFLVLMQKTSSGAARVSLCSVYVVLVSHPVSTMGRASIIFLAITLPMFWGPLLLRALAAPFLWIDAVLVSNLIGTSRIGNAVAFSDGLGSFQIFPPCSSFHNTSLAFLAWLTATQYFGHKWSPIDIAWCLLATLSVLSVNVVRLGLIGLHREHFDTIHGSFGSMIADGMSLSLILIICLIGVRRRHP